LLTSINLIETRESSAIFTGGVFVLDLSADADPSFGLSASLSVPLVYVSTGAMLTFQYLDSFPTTVTQKLSQVAYAGHMSFHLDFDNARNNLKMYLKDLDLQLPASIKIFTSTVTENMAFQANLVKNSSGRGVFFAIIPVASYSNPVLNNEVILHSGDDIYVRYSDYMPAANLLFSVGVPLLDFIEPSPKHLSHFSTVKDCLFQLILFAADVRTGGKRLNGSSVIISPSRYKVKDGDFLPGTIPTALFSLGFVSDANSSGIFAWKPSAEEQGKQFEVCFSVLDLKNIFYPRNISLVERCIYVTVLKCKKCLLQGESLNQIASNILTDWRILWSINPALKDPAMVAEGALINVSIPYNIRSKDSLASLAVRFKTSIKMLLSLNPDITVGSNLHNDMILCVIPDTRFFDFCPAPPKSSTWEPLEKQYIPPDYLDNVYNWENIKWIDPRGYPLKTPNPNFPQRPSEE
jgi:hypothetical protein